MMKSSRPAAVAGLLLAVVALQWMLISFLLHERHSHHLQTATNSASDVSSATTRSTTSSMKDEQHPLQQRQISQLSESTQFPGVAATLLYSAPAWFHRRYPLMIQNALINTPKHWAIQLFVNPQFWKESVLPYHPGLPRLFDQYQDRIIITELPEHLQNIKQPNQRILLDTWFWESMVADQVLLFSGNGILCTHGNTPERWETLVQFDYIGTPSHMFGRQGGDGSTHSFRNRNLMLKALQFAPQNNIKVDPPEAHFFIKTLLKMKEMDNDSYIRIATEEDTQWFGGVQTTNSTVKGHLRPIPQPPMVVSGTQAQLEFQHREDLLMVCPELKGIFPSLHEPACFGAHPNPEKCKASICALQDRLPSQGC